VSESAAPRPDGPPLRKHGELLRSRLPLGGARVADVGCGDGGLARMMSRAGARVIGIDCATGQLARARQAPQAGDEAYLAAVGEALPLADGSLDIVVYFNALHHVAVERQDAALAEAARVLRPGGILCVVEPVAEGPYFEVMRPVEDETTVRAAAHAALRRAADGTRWHELEERLYRAPVRYPSYEAFRDGLIAVDPGRRGAVERLDESLRSAFLAAAERSEDGYRFTPPFRLNLVRRAS